MKCAGTFLLDSKSREEVEHLRFDTLLNEGTFFAEPGAVRWSESDEKANVFGIYSSSGILLSTVRAERITNAEDLKSKLDYDHLHEIISLPCGLLGKFSTRKEFQQQGFNTYLQYLAYEDFYAAGLKHVAMTLMPFAPRVRQLEKFGFEFIENPEGWRRYGYQSFGTPIVAFLDLPRNIEKIRSILVPKLGDLMQSFPYQRRCFH